MADRKQSVLLWARGAGLMRRTPFRRARASTRSETEQEREQRLMDKARRAMNSVVPRAAAMGLGSKAAAPIPKAAPVRNEAYRRLVAAMPCVTSEGSDGTHPAGPDQAL